MPLPRVQPVLPHGLPQVLPPNVNDGERIIQGDVRIRGRLIVDQTLSVKTDLFKASAYLANAQALAQNLFTIINFDTLNYDPNKNFDVVTHKGRYTAPVAGKYLVIAQVSTNAGASNIQVNLYKNGASVRNISPLSSTDFFQHGSTIVDLAAGDYIEIACFINAAGASASAGAAVTYFDIRYLTP